MTQLNLLHWQKIPQICKIKMKRIHILFIFILFGTACLNTKFKNLQQVTSKIIDSTDLIPLFKNNQPAPLFKTNVRLYGKQFGGLLLVKKMPDSTYRIVFTNETGIKFFDFELKEERLITHYCIEKFNKKAVLNTIANDIELLLFENRFNKKGIVLSDSEKKWTAYNFTKNGLNDYYFISKTNHTIERIEQIDKKKKKVIIDLYAYKGNVPSIIKIRHKAIRLQIDLLLLER
jgi:hypothetical protein